MFLSVFFTQEIEKSKIHLTITALIVNNIDIVFCIILIIDNINP